MNMQKQKKLISFILASIIILSLIPVISVNAENDFEIRDGVLIKYKGLGGNVTIPNSVTRIENYAFAACISLTNIIIPSSVIEIGYCAFMSCSNLTSITMQNGVTEIGSNAFDGCESLASVTIPGSVNKVGYEAFKFCLNLKDITIQNGVNEIGEGAFSYCENLKSVSIPNSIIFIGSWAFAGCKNLTGITIPDSVLSIEFNTFTDCESLTSITIPNSIREIGEQAFMGCLSLKSVTIPTSVIEISSQAFYGCESLTSITIPNSVANIGEEAFHATKLTSIIVDTNNKNYATIDGVLYNKDKTTILRYPSRKTNNNFTIPNSVTKIESYAFYGCENLINVTIPDSVTVIGKWAFYGCINLTGITIPKSIRKIELKTFERCENLISVIIPSSVVEIGKGAFYCCKNLTSVIIPSSVVEIEDSAFEFCPNLTMYGISGSYAEKYAKERDIKFVAGTPAPMLSATPTSSTVLVNGKQISFDAYNIDGNNYFKLRDLAYVLNGTTKQFEVGYDSTKNAINLTSGKSYTIIGGEMSGQGSGIKTATPTNSKIYLDGKEVKFTAYTIEGNNFFKLRDIGQTFDFNVSWDGSKNTIIIDTSKRYILDEIDDKIYNIYCDNKYWNEFEKSASISRQIATSNKDDSIEQTFRFKKQTDGSYIIYSRRYDDDGI